MGNSISPKGNIPASTTILVSSQFEGVETWISMKKMLHCSYIEICSS